MTILYPNAYRWRAVDLRPSVSAGAGVASWLTRDHRATGAQAATSQQPLLVRDGICPGRDGVSFDATDDTLHVGAVSTATEWTAIVVVRTGTLSPTGGASGLGRYVAIGFDSANSPSIYLTLAGSAWRLYSGSTYLDSGVVLAADTTYVLTARRTAAGYEIRHNGATAATGALTDFTPADVWLGSRASAIYPCGSQLADVLLAPAIPDGRLANIERALMRTYKVAA